MGEYMSALNPGTYDDDQDDALNPQFMKLLSPVAARQLVPAAAAANPATQGLAAPAATGPQPIVRPGLAGRMQQMLAAQPAQPTQPMTGVSNPPDGGAVRETSQDPDYMPLNYAAPSTLAARAAAPAPVDAGLNPDPDASLRPGGTNPEADPSRLQTLLNPAAVTGLQPAALQPATSQPAAGPVAGVQPGVQPLQPAQGSQPLQPAGPRKHGFWDTFGSIVVPGAMAMSPNTSLGQLRLASIQQERDKAAAALANTQSQTEERAAEGRRADAQAQENAPRAMTAAEARQAGDSNLEGSMQTAQGIQRLISANGRNQATLTKAQETEDQLAADHGMKPAVGDDGKRTYVPDADSPVTRFKQAQTEYKEAQAAYQEMKGDPNSLPNKQVAERFSLAQQRLSLSRDQYLMHAFGTDSSGAALPGTLQTREGTSVGTANAANVRPTATQRDAAGRAEIGENIRLRLLHQLQDPNVRAALGPVLGRAKDFQGAVGSLPPELSQFGNDLKSYAAFQAGMHPVRGIGGLQYFDKVLGGLGQTPGQLEGKLRSGHAVATDVINVGKPRIAAGSAKQPGHAAAPAPQLTPGGGSGFNWEQYGQVKP